MSGPGKPGPPRTAKCGTRSGYLAHQRHKEPTCESCRAANTEYIKANPASILRNKARTRAQAELARLHPEEFFALLQKHRDQIAKEEGGAS